MRRADLARLLGAAALALIAAGCQTASPTVTSTAGMGSPAPGTASAGPGATDQPVAVEGDVEIGPGTFFLADPRVGLDALTSYTETLKVSFEGTVDGQARSWSKTLRLKHTAQPSMSMLTIETSGDTPASEPGVIAEADGTTYELGADGTCAGRALDPASSLVGRSEPASVLPALMGAEEAGSETVNGVPAHRYTFDGLALLESGGPVTAGEIWVAADGGHVLRYLRTTTADAAYLGDGLDGKVTWDYGLSDVNALATIALPDACRVDAPILSAASNVLLLPRYTGFDTQSSIAEVIAFYKQQLPTRGWAVRSEPFKDDVTAIVEFSKGDQVMTLIITTSESGRRVDLAMGGG